MELIAAEDKAQVKKRKAAGLPVKDITPAMMTIEDEDDEDMNGKDNKDMNGKDDDDANGKDNDNNDRGRGVDAAAASIQTGSCDLGE